MATTWQPTDADLRFFAETPRGYRVRIATDAEASTASRDLTEDAPYAKTVIRKADMAHVVVGVPVLGAFDGASDEQIAAEFDDDLDAATA